MTSNNSCQEVFPLTMDYQISIEKRLKSLKSKAYFYIKSHINDKNFPRDDNEVGKKKLELAFYHPNKPVDADHVISQMQKRNKPLASLRELLAFGEFYPEIQMQFPIVALGSILVFRKIPYLSTERSQPCIRLAASDKKWDARCRFLIVTSSVVI